MSVEKPQRRCYQFSLKTLLVVMTVATVAFGGWVQYRRQRAQENRDRVAALGRTLEAIETMGGYHANFEKRRPRTWIEEQFNDPGDANDPVWVYEIWFVWLKTDAGLMHVEGINSLEEVNLSNADVTDAGLRHLQTLTNLIFLGLGGTKVSDAGLEHVRALTKLESLYLWDSDISDKGLEHLKGLTNLRELDLHGTEVSDIGLEHLDGLTGLNYLNLHGTKVTDAGIETLQQALPKCRITQKAYWPH